MQQKMYKAILSRNYATLSAAGAAQVSLLNIAIELKKVSNHPYLFDGSEPAHTDRSDILKGIIMNSGKMVLLDKLLARLKKDGHRVLIFSQMVRMLDVLSDYMGMRGYIHQRLDGMVSSDNRRKAIERFNAEGSPDFAFLLSTRAGGLGINLETADTVIIFDSDWNPQNDLQAMARAHRLNSKRHVNVYRLLTKDTVEEDVIERAKRKMVLEYAIIHQMDTSGTNFAPKDARGGKDKGQGPSKEDLEAALKFGARSMFTRGAGGAEGEEQQQEKLERLDIDALLADAEAHETQGDSVGAASGGEDFLKQFAKVQDFKADDMSWDDIMGPEEVARIKQEEAAAQEQAVLEALAASNSRRKAAQVSADAYKLANGTRAGSEQSEGEEGRAGSSSGANKKKASGGGNASASAAQRAAQLSERDLRVLFRSIQRWGDLNCRYDEIVRETKLERKNRAVLLSASQDLIEASEKAIHDHKEFIKGRIERGEEILTWRQKAVLVECRGIKGLNAETIVHRHYNLRLLVEVMRELPDPFQFQMPFETKGTLGWHCEWTTDDDIRLLIGVYLYGLGEWEKIEADARLQFAGKFFLEEGKQAQTAEAQANRSPPPTTVDENGQVVKQRRKRPPAGSATTKAAKPIPNAVHLVRRVDYLLVCLDEWKHPEKKAAAEAEENEHANAAGPSKSVAGRSAAAAGKGKKRSPSVATGSPAPGKRARASVDYSSSSSPESEEEDPNSGGESMDEGECKEFLRPAKRQLKRLKNDTESLKGPAKLAALKECLAAIGKRIDEVVGPIGAAGQAERRAQLERHLWHFVTFFWPSKDGVKGSKIRGIYEKLNGINKEAGDAGGASAAASTVPAKRKVSAGAGGSSSPSPAGSAIKKARPTSESAQEDVYEKQREQWRSEQQASRGA